MTDLRSTGSQSGAAADVEITARSWDPAAAGRRAVEKHGEALRRLADDPEEGGSLSNVERYLPPHTPGCIAGDIDGECPCEQGDRMTVIARREAILAEVESDLRGLVGDDHNMGEEFLADQAEEIVGDLVDQLLGAVGSWRKYAQHLPDCAVRRDPRLRFDACTCGLTALATAGGQ